MDVERDDQVPKQKCVWTKGTQKELITPYRQLLTHKHTVPFGKREGCILWVALHHACVTVYTGTFFMRGTTTRGEERRGQKGGRRGEERRREGGRERERRREGRGRRR